MDIYLSFADPISEAYQQKLQTFVDGVLAQGITENRPPIIWFTGLNNAQEIYKLRRAFRNQNEP